MHRTPFTWAIIWWIAFVLLAVIWVAAGGLIIHMGPVVLAAAVASIFSCASGMARIVNVGERSS